MKKPFVFVVHAETAVPMGEVLSDALKARIADLFHATLKASFSPSVTSRITLTLDACPDIQVTQEILPQARQKEDRPKSGNAENGG